MENKELSQELLDHASALFRAAAHKLRLTIITLLDHRGEINVNEIYTTLKLEQSITSQHLKILRNTDIVKTRRDGKMIFYSLNYEKLANLSEVATKIEQLTRDKVKVKKVKV